MTRWDAICIAVSESKPLRPGEGARIIAFVKAFLDGRTIECAARHLRGVPADAHARRLEGAGVL